MGAGIEQAGSFTRRRLLQGAAAGAAAGTVTGQLVSSAWGAAPRRRQFPLPSADELLADVQTMCAFGPRLPGTKAHAKWTQWQIDQLAKLERYGVQLQDCDSYPLHTWQAKSHSLEVLGGAAAGSYPVATAIVRAQETGSGGVTGPLVYGGRIPQPAITEELLAEPLALKAVAERYPAEVRAWIEALPNNSELGGAPVEGSILVLDADTPLPLTTGVFVPLISYIGAESLATTSKYDDYKRPWIGPWPETSSFKAKGVKAVILIADCSFGAIEGNFSPHTGAPQSVPSLVVDRDTGAKLREACAQKVQAKATLVAPLQPTTVRGVTAVLPGADATLGKEVLALSSHLDGQNFAEENGTIAALRMLRYFATLPPEQRLQRTLAVGMYPAHMTYEYPVGVDQWLDAKPELAKRAAAGVAMEHLGCINWIDSAESGYHSTGVAEPYGVWTTLGAPLEVAKAALEAHNVPDASLLHGPLEYSIGNGFKTYGIPYVGGIAGPVYLLQVAANSNLDKFDATIAAQQVKFYTAVLEGLDKVSYEQLRKGDPTLGTAATPPIAATAGSCGR